MQAGQHLAGAHGHGAPPFPMPPHPPGLQPPGLPASSAASLLTLSHGIGHGLPGLVKDVEKGWYNMPPIIMSPYFVLLS